MLDRHSHLPPTSHLPPIRLPPRFSLGLPLSPILHSSLTADKPQPNLRSNFDNRENIHPNGTGGLINLRLPITNSPGSPLASSPKKSLRFPGYSSGYPTETLPTIKQIPQQKQVEAFIPSTRVQVGERFYTRNKNTTTALYFRCSSHRGGCKATYCFSLTTGLGLEKGSHTCSKMVTYTGGVLNIKQEIEEFVKERIYDYVGQPPYVTACKIQNHFVQKYEGKTISEPLTVQQIQTLVIRTRTGEAKGDTKFSMAPWSTVSETDTRMFLQFDCLVNLTTHNNGVFNRILGWAHPDLIKACADGPSSYGVDGTFYCVPKGFKQLIVIMRYSRKHDLYIPVWWILLDGQFELLYRTMFHLVTSVMLRYDVPLRSLCENVCCDFEHGLINACKEAFNVDAVVGCFFHWLQAILRHLLLVIKFVKDKAYEILDACRMLTCIPPDEVWRKGIPYLLESPLLVSLRTTNLNQVVLLTNYLRHTWVTVYKIEDWNVFRYITADGDLEEKLQKQLALVQRANCACEGLNGVIGRRFSAENGHPATERFLTVVKTMSIETVQRMRRIEQEIEDKPGHKPVTFSIVPEAYGEYIPPTSITLGSNTFYFDVKADAKSQKDHHQKKLARARAAANAPLGASGGVAAPAHGGLPPLLPVVVPPGVMPPIPLLPRVAVPPLVEPPHAPLVAGALAPPYTEFVQYNPYEDSDEDGDEDKQDDMQVDDNGGSASASDALVAAPAAAAGPITRAQEWVCCDKCNKWRKVPHDMNIDELESMGKWYCRYNTWDNKNKCSVMEEKMSVLPVD